MNGFVVQAWINDVAANDDDDDEMPHLDLDKTPVRRPPLSSTNAAVAAANSSTRSASSFHAALVSQSSLSRPPQTAASPASRQTSRSRSPTKRRPFRKTEDLHALAVPVRFVDMSSTGASSGQPAIDAKLLEALAAVAAGEALLPPALRGDADFADDVRVRRHMWAACSPPSDNTDRQNAATLRDHEHLGRIMDKSLASSRKGRSEAAWNNFVHTPLLEHALKDMPWLEVEVITSAQIMPAFRPPLASGRPVSLPSSSVASSSSSSSNASGYASPAHLRYPLAPSAYKMVDYALVLNPHESLRRLIDGYLVDEPYERQSINQTRYEPLRASPAPIFIETKTRAGSPDSANVQLGIWVAAWRARMRVLSEHAKAAPEERLLTLPMIQVIGSVWSVLYVVDRGTEIHVLDGDCRIGNTSSMLGLYQLQAAIAALGQWVRETFEPWFTDLLTRAVENR